MNFEILELQFVQKRLGLIELVVDLVWRIVKKPHLPNFKSVVNGAMVKDWFSFVGVAPAS